MTTKPSHLLMKETEDGQLIVSSEVLKRIFGVTQRLISDWQMQGCPKYDRGWWNLKDVIEWRGLGRQKGQKKSDEAKKLEADADLKYAKARQEELKLAEMMGELIPKDLVEATLSSTFSAVRQRLLALPNDIRAECFTLYPESTVGVTKLADKAVRECLDYLAGHSDPGNGRKLEKGTKRRGRPRKTKVLTSRKDDGK